MPLIKTTELSGAALDYAVAKCEGVPVNAEGYSWNIGGHVCGYSTDWSLAGPIIEREAKTHGFDLWQTGRGSEAFATYERGLPDSYVSGPTPLIAAMRCYVASKLGDAVEVPEEIANA